ncbi:uncharacterized protein LOC117113941, partial [Anneissia japonica]|uniref:uncharacterized protein LOC117113941 n=1 Tax=Anneissia japonica TaxID=1529436 RepID=UPI0014259A09
MSKEGITEVDFRQLLVDVAEWYDRLGYLTMLKVLYRDNVNDNCQLISATTVMDLLRMLICSGNLSSENLTIIYDTVRATQQFGFESKIKDKLLPFENSTECGVTKFTQNRLKLLKLGTTLTQDDVVRLDGIYNIPLLKKYGDSWSLILDLEQRMKLGDGNMDNFIEVLRSNGLRWAVKALVDDNEADALMVKSPNLELPSHQDVTIREYLLNRQKKLCCNANRFTPATLNTKYQVDLADMFTDLEILKENKKKRDSKQTTLDDVLGIIKTPSCKVLIDGEGGIGKTTLLRYLAYKWSTESDETFKGKLVFPVNIRDMEEGEDILDVIVKQMNLENFNLKTNLPNNPNLIKRFIRKHDDEIVLLLDGLDELRVRNESPISLFRKEELENSTVILTTRSENIDEYIKESSVHLKVKGFNEHNINIYIKKYFDYVEEPALGDSLIRELSRSVSIPTWRNTHNDEYSMCKNPMLLFSICMMWEDKQNLPADKTDLLKEIYRSILNQFIEKQEPKEHKISRFEETPVKYVNAMLLLGKCMYNSLKRNQLLINKKDFEGKQEMIALAIKLGFVYKDAPNKDKFDDIFAAPHKLIVESLVGFYLYKLCDTTGLETASSGDMANILKPLDDNEWEMVIENEYLHIAIVCTIGFLGTNAEKILNHLITNSFSKYRSLIAYLDFVKEGHRYVVVKALDDHLTKKGLKIKRHIGDVCKSLKRFKHHLNPDVQEEEEHFIHLMRRVYEVVPRVNILEYEHGDRNVVVKSLITPLKSFCKRLSAEKMGRMFAHIMLAVPDQQVILKCIHEVCADTYVKYLTAEFQKLNLKYDITDYKLYASVLTIPP